jgi:hypothetical protein
MADGTVVRAVQYNQPPGTTVVGSRVKLHIDPRDIVVLPQDSLDA